MSLGPGIRAVCAMRCRIANQSTDRMSTGSQPRRRMWPGLLFGSIATRSRRGRRGIFMNKLEPNGQEHDVILDQTTDPVVPTSTDGEPSAASSGLPDSNSEPTTEHNYE